ncbi:DUF4166 domain-containing protein [Vulcaniibacterium tengchongense]|uniref:Uncharacterized protein DUF4166 n=1 Tax=Vulcaniibacterium tengchongense TaxID=1273429 RepID=A0A3N4VAA9_9GAMM|nr:DUF4166 domain-containing protein [Vulcaniibacterium tengchongense]RPE79498.1 uncharacterized protein DUF4166 [Vulcaniibacterium tengchongense]
MQDAADLAANARRNATPAAAPLFRRLLGADFERLAPRVRALHARDGGGNHQGAATVECGRHWLARLCARAARLPPAMHGPIAVEIAVDARGERWTRRFGRHAMRSRLWARDGLLCERLGLATFGFRIGVEGGAIAWRVARVRALGVPLPPRWFAGVRAREAERDGRYRFEVEARLPRVGLLVRYRGWLDVD